MPFLFQNVKKQFLGREGAPVPALDAVSFRSDRPEIVCVVGPTGSGKTTVLRLAAGLERPDEGSVLVDGADPAGLAGRIGYLTQRHTLFPWRTVAANIGLPLEVRGMPDGEVRQRVASICDQLGLAQAAGRYPHELSGGMQQRAALGRLLAQEAGCWLMDEPFSALDERTRHQLQRLLIGLAAERELSVLFVTHSIDEAVALADRVIVLSAGPGRVVDDLAIADSRPRDRLSPAYGALMERIRTRIESVLEPPSS